MATQETPIETAQPTAAAHEVRTFSDSDIINTAAMTNNGEIVVAIPRSSRLKLTGSLPPVEREKTLANFGFAPC